MNIQRFQQKIVTWYQENRRDMPWRNTFNPYKILVSEVMLQQTQVSRVTLKYKEFIRTFPNTRRLAKAPTSQLLKVWQGLGYWRRALFLREAARVIQQKYKGKFPHEPALLEQLPGIGHYTARAVACFAFQNQEAFIDTNIRRIYIHFFFPLRRGSGQAKKISDKEILKIAQKAVRLENPREWHYALFDYGATFLTDKKINKRSRHYHKQAKFVGSFRSFRAKAVKFLLSRKNQRATSTEIKKFLKKELFREKSAFVSYEILQSLEKDGLIRKLTKNVYIV
jgi:A/G-specific adenine glycosylase